MRRSGWKINSLFRKRWSHLKKQIRIILSFEKTQFSFACITWGQKAVCFVTAQDLTAQSHWSTDCNSLIFGSHFFGVCFICLFLNSPKPSLAPISSFSLRATGSSCLIYLSPEEERVEGHAVLARKGEDLESWLAQSPFSRRSVLQDRTGWLTLHCQQPTYLCNIVHDRDFKFPIHERAIRVGDFII